MKRKYPTTKEERRAHFINHLKLLQNPNRLRIKKADGAPYDMLPMLEQTAALHLAVYDGVLPNNDLTVLTIMLQDLPRNPRKGNTAQWKLTLC